MHVVILYCTQTVLTDGIIMNPDNNLFTEEKEITFNLYLLSLQWFRRYMSSLVRYLEISQCMSTALVVLKWSSLV